jgi:haloalkane dehalogenase
MNDLKWVDRREYPFISRYLHLEMGRMHYVDEGKGRPIVMVHGNPTWSFLYRKLIRGLSTKYRCIAMDHIGFGLSDKPPRWSYLPRDHARNFASLVERLGLKDITLIVQDWGGPIGLSYALREPENVRSIIILNTWLWPVSDDAHFERFSRVFGSALGRCLIERFNLFARHILKMWMGDKSKLPPSLHKQYLEPLDLPRDRKGCAVFPREIVGSSDWLADLWSQARRIRCTPALVVWGMKDIAFRTRELARWAALFRDCRIIKFEDAGHLVQEEQGSALCPIIDEFLSACG